MYIPSGLKCCPSWKTKFLNMDYIYDCNINSAIIF